MLQPLFAPPLRVLKFLVSGTFSHLCLFALSELHPLGMYMYMTHRAVLSHDYAEKYLHILHRHASYGTLLCYAGLCQNNTTFPSSHHNPNRKRQNAQTLGPDP